MSAKTGWGYDTTMTTKGSLTFYTHEYFGSLCNGMRVSMGISRTNTFGFRNLNASKYAVTSGSNAFRNTHQLGLDDYGSWMIRQIAVKDKAGKLVVKTFTKETTPRILTSRYASVLTGTPKGKLVPKAGKVNVKGTLKSWHYYGRLVNVQNQQVVVQVRQPHKVAYTTRATATTSRTGAFSTNLNTAGLKGYDVRVAFVSKIPMTASSYTFLGTIS
ncbi:MAG TPA: hypothetical protein VFG33_05205 [Kribbella sp.]|uniref:hypothetical protein n=1 Tax=Kribbella sp. TaxID=1871183 RepID=UPI002D7977C1|nr:hypothetical protein [Kribbella sp.]HET6292745.1 hypothetical protein [Kribbella sp.]